jgi:hypothetical protein
MLQPLAVIEVEDGFGTVTVDIQQPDTVIDVVELTDEPEAVDVESLPDLPAGVTVEDGTPTVYIEVEPSAHMIEVEVIRNPVVAIDIEVQVMPGPEGPEGPPASAFAEGTQAIASITWIMDYDLDGKPAAFRFFDEFGGELEPSEITYVNPTRSIAQWPEPISGSWIIS